MQDRLFTEILHFSQQRILQRLMPVWYPAPSHWNSKAKSKRTSLHHRISTLLLPILQRNTSVKTKLESVLEALRPLEIRLEDQVLHKHVEQAVRCCAELSNAEEKSLELQFKSRGDELTRPVRKVVAQVDKIARYLLLCKDLAKILARPASRSLFRRLHLQPLLSPSPFRPRGAAGQCYVHAEVQLLLHYDQKPCLPLPRAIGCSKSACFLCDNLIRRHGKFKVSLSHQRIYPKWTITNVEGMRPANIQIWSGIIKDMVAEMREMTQSLQSNEGNILQAPIESRACLPLSSRGTSPNVASQLFEEANQDNCPPKTTSRRAEVGLLLDMPATSLPFSSLLPFPYRGIRLVLDKLTIIIEVDKGAVGKISLQSATNRPAKSRSITIEDLSCTEEMVVAPLRGDNTLSLNFQMGCLNVLQVDFEWNILG